jgi:acetoin utilization deacetylase AcuC-like enzyme
MTLALYTHADCRAHFMGRGHPECPERLDAIHDHLIATGLIKLVEERDAPLATAEQLQRAHTAAHVAELHAAMEPLTQSGAHCQIDPDTSAGPGSWQAALRAAGAAVAATDAVIDGSVQTAFCAVRPPGHHAERAAAMGFCFFNNVAVAARHALDVRGPSCGIERVAVIDFDVHHGNGTEDIVAGDERMLMVSIFQHPLYPYSGVQPLGANMVNVPIPPYGRGAQVREAVQTQWLPRLEDFKPQMLFISAGFDAHREDDLGQLGLVEDDYAWITRQLVAVAERHARGRIVSCLEGGYNLSALARSVAAHLRVLGGLA